MSSLNALSSYIQVNGERLLDVVPSLVVLVKQSTSSFNESNFNVAKALLGLFTSVFDVFATYVKSPGYYICVPATKFAAEKIGDRKLSDAAGSCLVSLCTVKDPQKIILVAMKAVGNVPSPLVHEGFLNWFKTFTSDFGAASFSGSIQEVLVWLLKVSSSCAIVYHRV